jgi:hypothetical protein
MAFGMCMPRVTDDTVRQHIWKRKSQQERGRTGNRSPHAASLSTQINYSSHALGERQSPLKSTNRCSNLDLRVAKRAAPPHGSLFRGSCGKRGEGCEERAHSPITALTKLYTSLKWTINSSLPSPLFLSLAAMVPLKQGCWGGGT